MSLYLPIDANYSNYRFYKKKKISKHIMRYYKYAMLLFSKICSNEYYYYV